MTNNPILLLILSTVFAIIPIVIWLYLTFINKKNSKKIITLVFLLGCFTAPFLLGVQYLPQIIHKLAESAMNSKMVDLAKTIEWFGNFLSNTSPNALIGKFVKSSNGILIATFILFAFLEEVIKLYVITAVDRKTVLIKTIGDSIKYAITAALGFSFGENIYYLFEFWTKVDNKALVQMYLYRSIFTTGAHMIYSGIFGYFYGIGKFAIDITKQKELAGESSFFNTILSKIFFTSKSKSYQNIMIAKGLIIAIIMHATSNYLLEKAEIKPVIIFVVLGYTYMQILLKRKAGNLILATDLSTKKKATIAKTDENVVVELIGMWFKEKNYTDVIHICERLLERDPNNNVVQIFKARALDEMQGENSAYKDILSSMFNSTNNTEKNKNIISKHIEEKEELKKTQRMIKKRLKKEGKEFKKQNNSKNLPKTDTTTFNVNL